MLGVGRRGPQGLFREPGEAQAGILASEPKRVGQGDPMLLLAG